MRVFSLVVSSLFVWAAASEILDILPDRLNEYLINDEVDLLIDTRRFDEWRQGHIEGATFVDSLQLASSTPDIIDGCQGSCRRIVVYCRTGNRAAIAANKLVEFGFQGEILNGQGVDQWTDAGFSLVMTPSVDPPCAMDGREPCMTMGGNGGDNGPPSPPTIGGVPNNEGQASGPVRGETIGGKPRGESTSSGQTVGGGGTDRTGAAAEGDSGGPLLRHQSLLFAMLSTAIAFVYA